MGDVLLMWDVIKTTKHADGSYCVQGMYRGQPTRNFWFGYGMTEEEAIKDMKSRFKNGNEPQDTKIDVLNKVIKNAKIRE